MRRTDHDMKGPFDRRPSDGVVDPTDPTYDHVDKTRSLIERTRTRTRTMTTVYDYNKQQWVTDEQEACRLRTAQLQEEIETLQDPRYRKQQGLSLYAAQRRKHSLEAALQDLQEDNKRPTAEECLSFDECRTIGRYPCPDCNGEREETASIPTRPIPA